MRYERSEVLFYSLEYPHAFEIFKIAVAIWSKHRFASQYKTQLLRKGLNPSMTPFNIYFSPILVP